MPRDKPEQLPELSFAGIPSFMKAEVVDPEEITDNVDAAVVGVPFDGGQGKRAGARFGPRAIRDATGVYSYYNQYKGRLVNVENRRTIDYSELELRDCGDAPTVPTDIHRTRKSVEEYVRRIAARTFPIVLGGDHYITYPSYTGVAETFDASVGVIQIDAHSDTVGQSSLYGKHFNGSPMARIADTEYGDYENHAVIGLRGHEAEGYFEWADGCGTYVATMEDIRKAGIETTVDEAIEHVTDCVDYVYLTIDIDAVDPSFAPGTGSPQPGGLSSDEIVRAMDRLGDVPEIIALDLMEVAPKIDPTGVTPTLAAKTIVRFLEQRYL